MQSTHVAALWRAVRKKEANEIGKCPVVHAFWLSMRFGWVSVPVGRGADENKKVSA